MKLRRMMSPVRESHLGRGETRDTRQSYSPGQSSQGAETPPRPQHCSDLVPSKVELSCQEPEQMSASAPTGAVGAPQLPDGDPGAGGGGPEMGFLAGTVHFGKGTCP